MNGQTIAEAKLAAPESLWHFLLSLPGTIEAQQLYGLMIAGTLGMIANWLVKWLRGDIAGSLWCYLFHQNVRGTVLSLFSFIGLALTSITANVFVAEGGAFVGWTNVLWFGLTQGFAVDAIANKGDRKQWTDDEREARENIKSLESKP